jgi:hypothetical protein
VEAPGKDGNASILEQVKRPNPWRNMMTIFSILPSEYPLPYPFQFNINPLNAELNPTFHLLALLGGATIVVVSRLRVKQVRLG